MVIFEKVRFKNFGSFGNHITEVIFDDYKMTLVTGSNGHGKSYALLDSITFALFGKPFRKINIPLLVNTINNKDCLSEIYFRVGTDKYRVSRGLAPKKFEIYKNDVLLSQNAKSKDYQNFLEEQILKMNYQSFTQIVTLGSSSFIPFMQLTAAERRNVIEDILDIKIFSLMNVNIKAKLSLIKDDINDKTKNIEILKEKISIQEENLELLHQRKNKNISENVKKITQLEEKIQTLSLEIEKVQSETKSISEVKLQKNKVKDKITKITNLSSQIGSKNISIGEDINFFEKNENCPVCSQDLDQDFKQNKVTNLEEKKKTMENAISELIVNRQSLEKEVSILDLELDSMMDIISSITQKQNSIQAAQNYIKDIRSDMKDVSDYESDIDKSKDTCLEYKTSKSIIVTDIENQIIKQDGYNIIQRLLKDSGIKSRIIKNYLPVMNELINKHLAEMNFFISFYLDEEFNEIIKSRHRDKFAYMNFSEGEKSRIDLAILLAWREIAKLKNSTSCNILILDEVFDSSLDAVGVDDLMKLLRKLSLSNNIFIITHKGDQLSDRFDRTMHVVKKNNFSSISEK
tara:strand:- start:221 stop:1942 length:1722 start_codon:yes stop_codon:yes gene_type:complete